MELPDLRHCDALYMWLINRERVIVDITQATLDVLHRIRDDVVGQDINEEDPIGQSVPLPVRIARLERIFESGTPDTMIIWLDLPVVGWRKFVFSTTRMTDDICLTVASDITRHDPKALWLKRVDVQARTLNLGPEYDNGELRYEEYSVLRGLLHHVPYDQMAADLEVSKSTITWRINKLKALFNVSNVPELFQEVSGNGLIHMLSLTGEPVNTENELYAQKGLP